MAMTSLNDPLRELAVTGGEPLASTSPDLSRLCQQFGAVAGTRLAEMLTLKNGFYAFEGALHVLADIGGNPPEWGLYEWNASNLWRHSYSGMADSATFFAEDVFGKQFCIRDGAIHTFEPETGAFEAMAADLREWASKILDDYPFWTGHPLATKWQVDHGRLPVGSRLVPITPFVMGGAFMFSMRSRE